MKRSVWVGVLAFCFGCTGRNTVAGADETAAEQLAASLPAWCQRTCTFLAACESPSGCDCAGDVCDCSHVSTDCLSDCQQEMHRFTSDDSCAARGRSIQTCFDALKCDDSSTSCKISAADTELCPGDDDGDAGPPIVDNPASAGTSPVPTSTGGSSTSGIAGAGSGGASGGTGARGGLVSCESSFGTGGSAAGGAGSSEITCDDGLDSCDDGHTYSWLCVRGSQGQIGCTCFVDSQVTSSFDPGSTTCPTMPSVNAGCGWNLAN